MLDQKYGEMGVNEAVLMEKSQNNMTFSFLRDRELRSITIIVAAVGGSKKEETASISQSPNGSFKSHPML